ncbi:MAG: hypothetical protein AAF392_01280 [Bacteroidota bacterium]
MASDNEGESFERIGNSSILTTDIYVQLNSRLLYNQLIKWLRDLIFLPDTTSPYQASSDLWELYKGRVIGSIQLQRQGVSKLDMGGMTASRWWSPLGRLLSTTTRDWVIRDYSSFRVGDRLDDKQLKSSQNRLNNLPYLREAEIGIAPNKGSSDTVDLLVTTQDAFPIKLDLASSTLMISHQNVGGWGHAFINRFSYDKGLGYGFTYRAPNIQGSYVTGELQYLNTQKEYVRRLGIYRDFTQLIDHAGAAEVSYKGLQAQRLLDGDTAPTTIPYKFRYQNLWLGKAFQGSLVEDSNQAHVFLTAKVANQSFTVRPEVSANLNKDFHGHTFVIGSWGFARKGLYAERFVHDVGRAEVIPCGAKVNLIGGYQLGEFFSRPYLRLDAVQAGLAPYRGYLYTSVKLGGFLHNQAIEQGIVSLATSYFTPLLQMSSCTFRQFIDLSYLAGLNMFTGELISTHTKQVSRERVDPFPAGTRRLKLHLETVLWPPRRLAGCQVAVLGFVDVVRLQDASHTILQSTFCEGLGMGFRLGHERFAFGTLQVKVGYCPILQTTELSVNKAIGFQLNNLDIREPDTIPFR